MDLQNEAIELQKVFHQDYKTYWEETEAIKAHLEARFKALGLYDVVGQSEQLPIYYQVKQEFITPELKKRIPSITEWAFEKKWWINNNIAKENEIEPIKK